MCAYGDKPCQLTVDVAAMGSYGDRWLQCTWCWRWGKTNLAEGEEWDDEVSEEDRPRVFVVVPLEDHDGSGLICPTCLLLDEPPWWPNNRRRCALALERGRILPMCVLSVGGMAKRVADFVVENDS